MDLKSEEAVGKIFDHQKFLAARNLAFNVVRQVSKKVTIGMTENDGIELLNRELEFNGCTELWHPHKFRIGPNTTLAFREKSEPGVTLQENDIFFIDMGAVFENHESDFAETFIIGQNHEYKKIIEKSKIIFDHVKEAWKTKGLTGRALYELAEEQAIKHGYVLNQKELGHRLGDYPHAVHHKGKLGNIDYTPSADRWVLEIHISHANMPYGAFYEDVLR